MRVCCGNEFFAGFSRFWRCSFSFKMPFQNAIEILDFWVLAPRSGCGASLGQEKLQSCQRKFIGFCNLALANCIGMAASQLFCVAVAQVVLGSFLARCLQIVLRWLHQCCSAWLSRT